jgi:hypothetical protein
MSTEEQNVIEQDDVVAENEAEQPEGSDEVSEETQKDQEEKPEFDKRLQQEQQMRANAVRRAELLQNRYNELESQQKAKVETTDDIDDPLEEINRLRNELNGIKPLKVELDALRDERLIAETQKNLESKYGNGLTNDAMILLREKYINEGYSLSGDDFPPTNEFLSDMRISFADAALKVAKNSSRTPEKKKAPAGDKTRAGSTPGGSAKSTKGTPAEVKAAMLKEGKFKGY